MAGLEYFQCILCKRFFSSLWKVERHVQQHNDDDGSPNKPRRRGMLPIKKAIFSNCHIPLVRTKASSSFGFTNGGKSAHFSKSKVTKIWANTNGESCSLESSLRKPRISSLKAAEKIQRLSSTLLKNTEIDDESNEDENDDEIDENTKSGNVERKKGRGRPPKMLLKCDKCGKGCKTYFDLEKHKQTHDPKFEEARKADEKLRIYPCPACDKKFKYKDNLRRHYLLHMPSKNKFICTFPDCMRKFSTHHGLRRHKQLHEKNIGDKDKLKCPLCPGVYSEVRNLELHLLRQHRPSDMTNPRIIRSRGMRKKQVFPVFQKKVARLSFPNQPHDSALSDSISLKKMNSNPAIDVKVDGNNVKMELSDVCGGIVEEIHLTDKIKLDPDGNAKHIKGETLTPVSCTPVLAHHSSSSKTHHGEQSSTLRNVNNKNPPEGESLSSLDVVGGKTNNYVEIPDKLFKCSICNMDFTRAWTLQTHLLAIHNKTILEETIKTDNDKLTLLCGTCAYLAKDGDDLKNHIKTKHSRKFLCPHFKCTSKFASQERLNRHIEEIHDTLEAKFECKFCKKKFGKKVGLKAHLNQVHPNSVAVPEKIACKICKGLYKPSSILNHVARHKIKKLDRKHKCMLCNDTFANATSLKRHIDCLHLGKPYNKERKKVKSVSKSVRQTKWYKPLMEKMGLKRTPGSVGVNNTDGIESEALAETIDGETAILGF